MGRRRGAHAGPCPRWGHAGHTGSQAARGDPGARAPGWTIGQQPCPASIPSTTPTRASPSSYPGAQAEPWDALPTLPTRLRTPLSRVGFAILALKSNHLPTFQAATSVPVTSAWAQVAAAASQLASYLHLPTMAHSLGPSQSTPTIPALTLAGSLSTASFCNEGQEHSPRRHGPRGFSHHLLLHYPQTRDFRQPFY